MNEIVAGKRNIHIVREQNYRVLEVDGYESVVFGCPPGMVKDFAGKKKALPRHYVIPERTYVSGRNNFDFEFVVYSFLFGSDQKQKVSVYCSADQKKRFKNTLEETLFGPRFHFLLHAQFRKLSRKIKPTSVQSKKFEALLTRVARDKKLFRLYKDLLKTHAGKKEIADEVSGYFKSVVKKQTWLRGKKISRLEETLAKNYIICAQLKIEMDLFFLADEKGRDGFLEDLIDFCEFDHRQSIQIPGPGRKPDIKIVQVRPSAFEIFMKKDKVGLVDISHMDPPERLPDYELAEKPFMGVTFIGVGSGFTPNRRNSCLVVWSEGKGIMVDSAPDSVRLALGLGIVESDIVYIFLSHVHSDHESGLSEMILSGKRVRVLSTRIIFESFLRKMEALTCFSVEALENFIEFFEVEPHKKVKIPGFSDTYMTFDYSLHSIPCGRFTLTHKDRKGNETTISHSGDMKYDLEKINEWYQEGYFPKDRYRSLLGFIWDADLIIHDVGGGNIHTHLQSLDHIQDAVVKNMILVHQHYEPDHGHRFKFAVEGQTRVLIPALPANGKNRKAEKSPAIPGYGSSLPPLAAVLEKSELVKYQVDEVVFFQGDPGEEFFIILNGFAELIYNDRSFSIYEEGKIFGELAAITEQPRQATIRAKSPLTLLKVPGQRYKQVKIAKKHKNSNPKSLDPFLISALAMGKIYHWKINDKITSTEFPGKISHILLHGKAEIQSGDTWGRMRLHPGDVIEENKTAAIENPVRALGDEVYTIGVNRKDITRLYQMFPSMPGSVWDKIEWVGKKLDVSPGAG